MSDSEFVIERYQKAFWRHYPDEKVSVTRRRSWFLVKWEKHGEKTCRLEELMRMTSVLEQKPISVEPKPMSDITERLRVADHEGRT